MSGQTEAIECSLQTSPDDAPVLRFFMPRHINQICFKIPRIAPSQGNLPTALNDLSRLPYFERQLLHGLCSAIDSMLMLLNMRRPLGAAHVPVLFALSNTR